jgi:membrane-anchored protein YejM (alkaline phosphatase superfamily)
MLAAFLQPVLLTRWQQMLMLLPLCLAVSVVYKTTRCERLRDIPKAALVSWVTIVIGMYVVGIALLVVYEVVTRYC